MRYTTKDLQELKPLTKDQIAKSAIEELTRNGARVRKVHNVPVNKNRRHHIQKGNVDIQGFSSAGLCLYCEVKTLNDRFSKEQIEILDDLDNCGGLSFVAVQVGTQVKIIPWRDYRVFHHKKLSASHETPDPHP